MSASREKKTRQGQALDQMSGPKTAREAQQRKEEHRSNILYATIGIVFVLVAIVAFVWRSNIIPKMSDPVTINGEDYSVAEVQFFYENQYQQFLSNYYYYLSYMGVDMNASMKDQTVNAIGAMLVTDATEGQTWFDYLMDRTLQQMITVEAMNDAAAAEGFEWTDELQAQLDADLASIPTTYNMSVQEYLDRVYDGLMSEETFTDLLHKTMLSNAYITAYQESLSYTDSDLEAAYQADPNSYDLVSYELATVSGAVPTTDEEGNTVEVTDEMTAAAMEEAKALADSLYAGLQSGGDLETLATANEGASFSESDGTAYSSLTSVVGDWLFDSARQEGDAAVLEDADTSTYYVVVYHGRDRQAYNTVDVRHILVQVDESGLDSTSETYDADLQARKDEARAKAEDLLAQWQAGEATEDSFAAMANENSEDPGSNTNGGLYEQVAQGQMVTEFNDWCFDPARQPGDTGIVYGESSSYKGYHVMYFSGYDIPYWQVQVTAALQEQDILDWHAEKTAGYTAEQHSFGLKFVG